MSNDRIMKLMFVLACTIVSIVLVSCVDPPSGIRNLELSNNRLIVISSPGIRCNIDYTRAELKKKNNIINNEDDYSVVEIIRDDSDEIDEVEFIFKTISKMGNSDGDYIIEVYGCERESNEVSRTPEYMVDSVGFTIVSGSLTETNRR